MFVRGLVMTPMVHLIENSDALCLEGLNNISLFLIKYEPCPIPIKYGAGD